jgi:hypothetical protein
VHNYGDILRFIFLSSFTCTNDYKPLEIDYSLAKCDQNCLSRECGGSNYTINSVYETKSKFGNKDLRDFSIIKSF